MAKNFVYDVYDVAIPGDLLGDNATILELADYAIQGARERTTLYCSPCEWRATRVSGNVGDFEVMFRVVRKRRKAKR